MPLLRELTKMGLSIAISGKAKDASVRLRRSARRTRRGLERDIKHGLADTTAIISEDPEPLVQLIATLWDDAKRKRQNVELRW